MKEEKRTIFLCPGFAESSPLVRAHVPSEGALFFVKGDDKRCDHRNENGLIRHAPP